MLLHGYECPECAKYHRAIDGYRTATGVLTIRCDACGAVEQIRKYRGVLPTHV